MLPYLSSQRYFPCPLLRSNLLLCLVICRELFLPFRTSKLLPGESNNLLLLAKDLSLQLFLITAALLNPVLLSRLSHFHTSHFIPVHTKLFRLVNEGPLLTLLLFHS